MDASIHVGDIVTSGPNAGQIYDGRFGPNADSSLLSHSMMSSTATPLMNDVPVSAANEHRIPLSHIGRGFPEVSYSPILVGRISPEALALEVDAVNVIIEGVVGSGGGYCSPRWGLLVTLLGFATFIYGGFVSGHVAVGLGFDTSMGFSPLVILGVVLFVAGALLRNALLRRHHLGMRTALMQLPVSSKIAELNNKYRDTGLFWSIDLRQGQVLNQDSLARRAMRSRRRTRTLNAGMNIYLVLTVPMQATMPVVPAVAVPLSEPPLPLGIPVA